MYQKVKTVGDYYLAEVASALQKAIRRGDEESALYWATELDLSGFGGHAWNRLRIITSEDVGLAEPTMPVTIRALYENWLEARKDASKENRNNVGRLYLVHAVILLSRALKSRMVDHATLTFYRGRPLLERREIPDEALDMHTRAGRNMSRGVKHFFDEAARLANESAAVPDRYRERAIQAVTKVTAPPSAAPTPSTEPKNGDLFDEKYDDN